MPFAGEFRQAMPFPREGTSLVAAIHDPTGVVDDYLRRYQAETAPR